MVHMVVVLGVLVVLPLAFGNPRRWAVAAAAVAGSFALPIGPWSGTVAALWLVVAAWSLGAIVLGAIGRPLDLTIAARVVAAGFATGAAGAFLMSRLGLTLFGIGEPIVELTAVHFTYAGVGTVTLAAATLSPTTLAAGPVDRTAAMRRAGVVAVVLTVAAPPLVALGFTIGHPLPQVGGAVVMSAGVLLTATLQLVDAAGAQAARRVWLVVSGLAPWAPMVLAVSWAASNFWTVPALSIPDMARTHGLMNVVFVVAGLWARRSWTTADRAGTAPTSAAPTSAAPISERAEASTGGSGRSNGALA